MLIDSEAFGKPSVASKDFIKEEARLGKIRNVACPSENTSSVKLLLRLTLL